MNSSPGSFRVSSQPDNDYLELRRTKAQLRSAGIRFVDLSEGLPDLEPDPQLVERLAFFCRQPQISFYPIRGGSPTLRKAIVEYLQVIGGYVEGMQILPSSGSKELIAHSSMALLNPGDIVLVPELHYPFYRLSALYAGATVITYPLTQDGRYQPDLGALEPDILTRAKLLWINYPHSPTGALLDPKIAGDLITLCRKSNTIIIADAAYGSITRSKDVARSIFSGLVKSEGILELHTFSKSLSIPGWRFGFVAGDPVLVDLLERSKAVFDSGIFNALQKACAYGLRHFSELSAGAIAEYNMRVVRISEIFHRDGLTLGPAEGTFYLWVSLPAGTDSRKFVSELLEKERILVLPGTFFGEKGKEFIRVSLTKPLEILEDAAKKIIKQIQLIS